MLGIKKNKAVSGNLSTILTIVIVVVVATVLWTVYKAVKKGSEAAGEGLGGLIVQQQTGVSVARQNFLKRLAADAHKLFYSKYFWGYSPTFNTDEEAVIRTLNQIASKNEAILFSEAYREIDGNSIKSGVDNDLNDTEISRIKTIVYDNLS